MRTLKGLGILSLIVIVCVMIIVALDAIGGLLPRPPIPQIQKYANNLGNGAFWVGLVAAIFGISAFFGWATEVVDDDGNPID